MNGSIPERSSGRLAAVFILAGLLLTAGCVRPPTPVLPAVPQEVLLQSLREQGTRFSSLQGVAALRVERGDESHSAKQVLLVKRPDAFRAEVLSPFGQPVATVTASGGRLAAFVPGENRYYTGPASAENLYRLARLPFDLPELLRFVLHDVPLLPGTTSGVAVEGGLYRLARAADDGRRQELFFDTGRRLRKMCYFSGKTVLLQAAYDNFRDADGLPLKLRLTLPAAGLRVDLEWRTVRADGDMPPERFTLAPPDGAQVQTLP